jgi:hypothetical protein
MVGGVGGEMGEKEDIAKDTGGGTDEKKPEVRKLFIN